MNNGCQSLWDFLHLMHCSLLRAAIWWGINFHSDFPRLWQVLVFLLLWPEELKQATNRCCFSITKKKKKKKKKEEEAEGERLTAGPLLLWNQGLPPSSAEARLGGFVSFPELSPSPTLSLAGFYPLCPQVPPFHMPAPHFPFHKALVSRRPTEKVSFEWYSGLGKPTTHDGFWKPIVQNQTQCFPFWDLWPKGSFS